MQRWKVNLVHFVEADSADAAIDAARAQCQSPVIGEAFVWGSSLDEQPTPTPPAEEGD